MNRFLNSPYFIVALSTVFAALLFAASRTGYIGDDSSTLSGIVVTALGIALFLISYAVLDRMTSRMTRSRQISRIHQIADDIAQKRTQRPRYDDIYLRRNAVVEAIGRRLERLLRMNGQRLDDLRYRLMTAGFFSERALVVYLGLRLLSPLIGALAPLTYGTLIQPWQPTSLGIGAALGGIIGFFSVDLYIVSRRADRQRTMVYEFPDIIDLLTVYTESGVAFDIALGRVVLALRRRAVVACEEVAVLERELQLLSDRMKAYENFERRLNAPMIRSFCAIMKQNEQFGSPITESLRRLGREARRELLSAIERRAARIPVLIQFPLLFFILPSLGTIIGVPLIINVIDAFTHMGGR